MAVNNRDNIPYLHQDSTGQYGQVIQSYVDNHPAEEFMPVRDGGNYGWPYCNPNPDTPASYDNMPFDRAYDMNADGHVDCSTSGWHSLKGFQALFRALGPHLSTGVRGARRLPEWRGHRLSRFVESYHQDGIQGGLRLAYGSAVLSFRSADRSGDRMVDGYIRNGGGPSTSSSIRMAAFS